MTALLPVLLAVAIGMGGSVQVAMLGALERQRGPFEAAWISGVGTVLMLALILGARARRGEARTFRRRSIARDRSRWSP